MRFFIPAIIALAFVAPAQADSIFPVMPPFPDPEESADAGAGGVWAGRFAAGYSASTGNTESSTLNARVLVAYQRGRFRHGVNFAGNRTTDRTGTTGERTVLGGKTEYRMDESQYLFLTAQYERDRFAGFDRRTSEAFGYGRHLFRDERHELDAEFGIGARQVRYVAGNRDNVAIARLASSWRWQVTGTTEFTSQVVHEYGSDNRFTEAGLALKTDLIGNLFSSISYTLKHNSVVPAGVRHTDTLTTVQLGYRF